MLTTKGKTRVTRASTIRDRLENLSGLPVSVAQNQVLLTLLHLVQPLLLLSCRRSIAQRHTIDKTKEPIATQSMLIQRHSTIFLRVLTLTTINGKVRKTNQRETIKDRLILSTIVFINRVFTQCCIHDLLLFRLRPSV